MASTPRPITNAIGLKAESVAAEQIMAPDSTTMEQLIACMAAGLFATAEEYGSKQAGY